MTFTFPVLETFSAVRCKWLNLVSADINAPMLTTFASWVTNGHDENEVSLHILAPRLAAFTCFIRKHEKYVLDGSSVVSTNISCHHDQDNIQPVKNTGLRIRKLLDEFTNLERLFLSSLEPQVSLCSLICKHNTFILTLSSS